MRGGSTRVPKATPTSPSSKYREDAEELKWIPNTKNQNGESSTVLEIKKSLRKAAILRTHFDEMLLGG